MINPDLDSTGGDQGQSMKSKSIQSSVNMYYFGPIPGIDVGMSWDWQFRVT